MPLVAPLHRQYKTARTETRCHLLLKIRQMATQTSASRDYVLFSSGKSATRKFLNCLMICGHSPWSAPDLKRHGSSKMPDAAWLEIPDFTVRSALDRYHPERLAPIFPGITHNNQRLVWQRFSISYSFSIQRSSCASRSSYLQSPCLRQSHFPQFSIKKSMFIAARACLHISRYV